MQTVNVRLLLVTTPDERKFRVEMVSSENSDDTVISTDPWNTIPGEFSYLRLPKFL